MKSLSTSEVGAEQETEAAGKTSKPNDLQTWFGILRVESLQTTKK